MIRDLGNEIILENKYITLHLLPYGATIYKLFTRDNKGNKENIVLSQKKIEDYVNLDSYFGMTCGRHAGRIENGKFKINDIEYNLTKNNGRNCLHGGNTGLSFRNWDYTYSKENDKMVVKFSLLSKHGEDGFPGNVNIIAQYTLIRNKVYLEFTCETDRPTYLNLTNHSYFNLYGKDKREIYDHELYISSDKYALTNEEALPTTIESVEDTPFDFRKAHKIGDINKINHEQIKLNEGYDNCFIFKKDSLKGLSLYLEESGRYMEMVTTNPTVVIYSYNKGYDMELDEGRGIMHGGLAIEPQYVPNAINRKDSEYFICTPERKYKECTIYTFGTR